MSATQPAQVGVARNPRAQPVVLVANHPDDPLDAARIQELLDEAGERGWRLVDFDQAEQLIQKQRPLGMIVNWVPSEKVLATLAELGCPAVRIGRIPLPGDERIPAVLPDYVEAGRMGAGYFANRGYQTIGLVAHEKMQILPLIEQGLRERIKAQGRDYYPFGFTSGTRPVLKNRSAAERQAYRDRELTEWLKALPKPAAVLAAFPEYGSRASVLAQQLGLAVPEDVAVLVLGDEPMECELSPVPISAIDQNRREIARLAVQMLGRMIHGRSVPPRTFVPPRHIITRRSTDILAVDHPLVVRTVRFIWDNLSREMSVDDIAEQMGVSRYKLERLFRQHFSRGINAELRRVRLERFRELLRTTDLPVHALAPEVGFNSPKYLHRTFRSEFGLTPRQYRLEARHKQAKGQAAE
jgi:LacI family transcriptional regulator